MPSNDNENDRYLTCFDRLFWVVVSLTWTGWRAPLVYVQADTVVRWQRERFRRFWARRSKVNQRDRGRPETAVEIRRLIERMVAANPLWGAPRIHGELKMLGIEISERTISRILRRLPRPPGQIWKTFLRNHLGQMVSIDFFTVPTITLKVLFVFIVLEHSRREVLHFNVTDHPTAAWTSQQIIEASPNTNLRAISCGIGTAFMATRFGRVSLRSKSKKSSQRPATLGRIHTPSG